MRQNYSNSKDSKHPGGAGRAGGTIKKFSRQQNGSRRMKWKGEANGGEPNCGPSTQPIQLLDRHIYKKPSVTINLFFPNLICWTNLTPNSGMTYLLFPLYHWPPAPWSWIEDSRRWNLKNPAIQATSFHQSGFEEQNASKGRPSRIAFKSSSSFKFPIIFVRLVSKRVIWC